MRKKTRIAALAIATGITSLAAVNVAMAAAPTITFNGVEGTEAPGGTTIPPYKYSYSVSDDNGIKSIKIDGKELNPNGGTDYDGTWTAYSTKDITITVTDTAGNTVRKKITYKGEESDTELVEEGEDEVQTYPATAETVYITLKENPTTAAETTAAPTTAAKTTVAESKTIAAIPTTKETVLETLPTIVETTQEETLPEEVEQSTEMMETRETIVQPTIHIVTEEETTQAKKISIITEPLVIERPETPDLTDLADSAKNKVKDSTANMTKDSPSAAESKSTENKVTSEAQKESDDASDDETYGRNDVNEEANSKATSSEIGTAAGNITNDKQSSKGEKSKVLVLIGILVLSVIALYNIFIIRLNIKRLRLYKAYVMVLSKLGVDTDTVLKQSKRNKEQKKKKTSKKGEKKK